MNGVYVYRGEEPKNFIKVGDRLYRIIEIKGNELKLVSNKRLDATFVWDDRYNTDKGDLVGINNYSKSIICKIHLLKKSTKDISLPYKITK